MSTEESEGAILHEFAHIIEPLLPISFQEKLNALRIKYKDDVFTMAGVVHSASIIPENRRTPDFIYARINAEFFSTMSEAWLNCIPRDGLHFDSETLGYRVLRNRQDLWTLFPDVASFLSTFLAPYSYTNSEIDRWTRVWLENLPRQEIKKLDDFQGGRSSNTILSRALGKLSKILRK
jgi:hypothetical protein